MKVIISQPNFLPWPGYLDRLRTSDIFVLLDTVQHVKRSWQFRNRAITRSGKPFFMTLNTVKVPRNTLLNQILISRSYDCNSILNLIKAHYYNTPRFIEAIEEIKYLIDYLNSPNYNYIDYVEEHLLRVTNLFNIDVTLVRASSLAHREAGSTPTNYLVQLCEELKADVYITAVGSKDYMNEEMDAFIKSSIKVKFHDLNNVSYIKGPNFLPRLSIVDYLMHQHPSTLQLYLDKTRKIT